MIQAGPILLKTHLRGLIEEIEASNVRIAAERDLQKAALHASQQDHGTEPACIRHLVSYRAKKAKNGAEASRIEDIADLYKFLIEGGQGPIHAPEVIDELSRVMALTNTTKPPKIEAIKKALGCSQGKAHKLRSLAAAKLATKSSSSSIKREHEHLADPDTGELPRDMLDADLGEWLAPEKPATFNIDLSHLKAPEPTAPIISDDEVAAGLEATQARLAALRSRAPA